MTTVQAAEIVPDPGNRVRDEFRRRLYLAETTYRQRSRSERHEEALRGWELCGEWVIADPISDVGPHPDRIIEVKVVRSGFGVSLWGPALAAFPLTFPNMGALVRTVLADQDAEVFGESGMGEVFARWTPEVDWVAVCAAPVEDRLALVAGAIAVLDNVGHLEGADGALLPDPATAPPYTASLPLVSSLPVSEDDLAHLTYRGFKDAYEQWREQETWTIDQEEVPQQFPAEWEVMSGPWAFDGFTPGPLVRWEGVGWSVLGGGGSPLLAATAHNLGHLLQAVADMSVEAEPRAARVMAGLFERLQPVVFEQVDDTVENRAFQTLIGLGALEVPPDAYTC